MLPTSFKKLAIFAWLSYLCRSGIVAMIAGSIASADVPSTTRGRQIHSSETVIAFHSPSWLAPSVK
eukprot:6075022-Pyramimonas_sp.AAC.1